MKKLSSKPWNQISTQLYIAFGGAVILIIIVSLLALFFLNYIGKVQQSVNEENIPEMTSAFAIAQQTAMLVAAAPRLTVSTPEQFETVVAAISRQTDKFETLLSDMMRNQGESEQTRRIQSDGVAIIRNIERTELLVEERFHLRQSSLDLGKELQGIQSEITPIVINEIDDQIFYMMTGYRSLNEAQSPYSDHFSESEFLIYRRLFELREAATIAEQLLITASTVNDAALLEPLRERFENAAGSINRSLDALKNTPFYDRLYGIFQDLILFGERENNGFDLRSRELAVDDELSTLLRKNQALGIEVVARVENVVSNSSLAAGEMAGKAASITATSAKVLLVFNIFSIGGAILIGWFLVQHRLIRRLGRISNQMQQMADGNLELDINTEGNDEIAKLAKALEVFRANAQEVQRLNLVEKLAGELQGKNQELAYANEELKRMQDQMVMREKLAALGQLTAGVAHEIKNPMNFIMNFSEVSQELIEELMEELAKNKDGGEVKEEYDSELVEELAEDLTGNMKRINEHGARANRIITDMLKMGRDGGEWQPTDLNVLLNDNVWIAFHSARATDSDFQLEIQEDYSQEMGKITVQPQDLGRVFLNLVTNACYATDEKRKMLADASTDDGTSNKDYKPTLKLSTRLVDDHVEVHIRDNGTGIPESALERIFNPFYTTKPPDQGTGLGLSLSNDIVRKHGGEFRVETEEGEYTDMIVVLPINPKAHQVIDDDLQEEQEGEDSATDSDTG